MKPALAPWLLRAWEQAVAAFEALNEILRLLEAKSVFFADQLDCLDFLSRGERLLRARRECRGQVAVHACSAAGRKFDAGLADNLVDDRLLASHFLLEGRDALVHFVVSEHGTIPFLWFATITRRHNNLLP